MSHEKEIVEAIDRLAATLNTLISAVESIYETHPNPEALLVALHARSERDTARELATGSDAALADAERVRQGLASLLRKRLHDHR